MRACGFLRLEVLAFGSCSVLMFTTAGPTCFAIVEKVLDSTFALGTWSGFASELSTLLSWPLTP